MSAGLRLWLERYLRKIVIAVVLLPLAGVSAAYLVAPALYEKDLATRVPHREARWTGSQTCKSCHPDQYATWHRTFHRTMTQAASPESVQGVFDGKVVQYWGVPARPVREGDEYFFEYLDPVNLRVVQRLKVVKTVGSRRYQQYVVEAPAGAPGKNLYRVPLLWHIGDRRWIHLNGAFLHSDETQHFDSHTALWNQNCIFCHNTGPNPGVINYDDLIARASRGEAVNSATDSIYVSKVAEMGISCEACHAPAGEHTQRNRNPLRRYLLHAGDAADPSIVNPARLDQQRSVEVCGQCHGQRLPDPPASVERWMRSGPVYRAGETLTDSVAPVSIKTPGPAHDPDMFRLRFWADGSPRLSAYEYQGIVASKCFLKDQSFTCNTCHSMHGGDVHGQIEPVKRTNAACASCHADLVENVAQHSRHAAGSTGSNCYDCHMPRMKYGVLEIHRTHYIHNPDPAHDAEYGRPNACTNCHLDKSLVWAAEKSAQWWGKDKYRIPTRRADGAPVELADSVAALFAGDPVQRAVAARLSGRRDVPLSAEQKLFLWPVLLGTLDNNYPTVRYFARQSLIALDEDKKIAGMAEVLREYDYLAGPVERGLFTEKMWQLWRRQAASEPRLLAGEAYLLSPDYELIEERVAELVALQISKEIHIGE